LKRGVVLLVVFGFLMLGMIFWPGTGRNWIEIDVRAGSNARGIANRLQTEGLIRSQLPFIIWTKIRGADGNLKIGRYRFSYGRSAWWLVDDLVNGRTQKVRLIIPEGFASWQIASRLEAHEICQADDFKKLVKEKKLEGYLFPATYRFNIGMSAETVVQLLSEQFEQIWTPEMESRAQEWGMSQQQVVTLASIVEREVKVPEELPLVSAVYHNRLKKKMRLEADPTVQYALGYWKKRLLFSDLKKTKSPYNTYLHKGLPPGPICNPGVGALKAVLWPADSDFLFFVAGKDGRHVFSISYQEHKKNIMKRNRNRRNKKRK